MNRAQFAKMFDRLQRTNTKYAECVKVTRDDGKAFRFTAHDEDIRLIEEDGVRYTYKAAGSFKMYALEMTSGLAVSNMDIEGVITDDSITDFDLENGLFESAKVELFLAYWTNLDIGILPLRTAWIGDITTTGISYKTDLRGIAQRLAQVFTSLTSLECRYEFCDADCTLNLADNTEEVTIGLSATAKVCYIGTLADYVGSPYQWGLIEFTSGKNAGLKMEIVRQIANRFELFMAMPYPIETGATAKITKGCAKTYDACASYGNVKNMGAEPYITGSDLLARYPDAKNT
jgi:uncharacterized phage protein (TIGR02218 family)